MQRRNDCELLRLARAMLAELTLYRSKVIATSALWTRYTVRFRLLFFCIKETIIVQVPPPVLTAIPGVSSDGPPARCGYRGLLDLAAITGWFGVLSVMLYWALAQYWSEHQQIGQWKLWNAKILNGDCMRMCSNYVVKFGYQLFAFFDLTSAERFRSLKIQSLTIYQRHASCDVLLLYRLICLINFTWQRVSYTATFSLFSHKKFIKMYLQLTWNSRYPRKCGAAPPLNLDQ